MKTGIELIAAERERQMSAEGWTPDHDNTHTGQELVLAALAYANEGIARQGHWLNYPHSREGAPHRNSSWPWEKEAWKPSADPVRNLVKAGALIAAEIDRLLAAIDKAAAIECQAREVRAELALKAPEERAELEAGFRARIATERKHVHPEAFTLMKYASDDGSVVELIWNSQDSVTPFCVLAKDGKTELRHVEWKKDKYCPDHVLNPGDRYFGPITQEAAERYAEERMKQCDGTPYELQGEERAAMQARVLEHMLRDETPDLLVFGESDNLHENQP